MPGKGQRTGGFIRRNSVQKRNAPPTGQQESSESGDARMVRSRSTTSVTSDPAPPAPRIVHPGSAASLRSQHHQDSRPSVWQHGFDSYIDDCLRTGRIPGVPDRAGSSLPLSGQSSLPPSGMFNIPQPLAVGPQFTRSGDVSVPSVTEPSFRGPIAELGGGAFCPFGASDATTRRAGDAKQQGGPFALLAGRERHAQQGDSLGPSPGSGGDAPNRMKQGNESGQPHDMRPSRGGGRRPGGATSLPFPERPSVGPRSGAVGDAGPSRGDALHSGENPNTTSSTQRNLLLQRDPHRAWLFSQMTLTQLMLDETSDELARIYPTHRLPYCIREMRFADDDEDRNEVRLRLRFKIKHGRSRYADYEDELFRSYKPEMGRNLLTCLDYAPVIADILRNTNYTSKQRLQLFRRDLNTLKAVRSPTPLQGELMSQYLQIIWEEEMLAGVKPTRKYPRQISAASDAEPPAPSLPEEPLTMRTRSKTARAGATCTADAAGPGTGTAKDKTLEPMVRGNNASGAKSSLGGTTKPHAGRSTSAPDQISWSTFGPRTRRTPPSKGPATTGPGAEMRGGGPSGTAAATLFPSKFASIESNLHIVPAQQRSQKGSRTYAGGGEATVETSQMRRHGPSAPSLPPPATITTAMGRIRVPPAGAGVALDPMESLGSPTSSSTSKNRRKQGKVTKSHVQ